MGAKDRLVGLPASVCDALEDYLAVRVESSTPVRGQVGHQAVPLVVTGTGRRVHVSHVTMLRQLAGAFVPDNEGRPSRSARREPGGTGTCCPPTAPPRSRPNSRRSSRPSIEPRPNTAATT
jgi:hypothetical protein